MKFSWRDTLENWISFLGLMESQIVIAINTSTDDTAKLVREYVKKTLDPRSLVKIDVIDIEIPYTLPDFDGRGKAAALAACAKPYCILLDADETLQPNQRNLWMQLAGELERNRSFDAFLIPVVDLIGDDRHYKTPIGSKFYLHRNSPDFTRGVVNYARRPDGTFDTTKSDSCELCRKDTGELVRAQHILMQGLPDFLTMGQLESGMVPYVIHHGWKNLEQRLRQSAFWEPHWSAREGKPVKTERSLADLEKISRLRHNLPIFSKTA